MSLARSKQRFFNSQLSVDIESFVGLDFHLPYAVAWCDTLSLIHRRFKFITPRAPPAVPITVVIAAQEVSLRLGAFLHGKRDIDRFEKVFGEVGIETNKVVDVRLDVFGVEPAEKVTTVMY